MRQHKEFSSKEEPSCPGQIVTLQLHIIFTLQELELFQELNYLVRLLMRQHKKIIGFQYENKNSTHREHDAKEANNIVVRKSRPLCELVGKDIPALVKLHHADFLVLIKKIDLVLLPLTKYFAP